MVKCSSNILTGIYVMLTSSCCEFVDTFTAVSVYSHLIGVLVGPAFCCVSFSWFRSEDDATTQSCSDESPDNDGMYVKTIPYTFFTCLRSVYDHNC